MFDFSQNNYKIRWNEKCPRRRNGWGNAWMETRLEASDCK